MIKFDLSNRVAVITGGAQGFGFAIAEDSFNQEQKLLYGILMNKKQRKPLKK